MKKLLLCSASVLGLAFATSAWADSATVYLNQTGDAQSATIDQSGNGNTVGSSGASFTQENGYDGSAGGNVVTIGQTGQSNSVSGYQSGEGNNAVLTQSGAYSGIVLQQYGAGNGVFSPSLGGWTNSNSYGSIVQDSSSYYSNTTVTQNGTNNVFDIGQGNNNNTITLAQSSEGYGSAAYIRQGTQYNTWDQNGVYFPGGGAYNTINVQQSTAGYSYNYVVAGQGGGNWNNLTITQNGDWLAADVIQAGNNNTAIVSQSGDTQIVGMPADGSIDTPFLQNGNGNNFAANQYGSTNVLNGAQNGNANSIVSSQNNGSTAALYQNGDNNNISSSQTGGATLTATQNASWSIGNYLLNNQTGNSTATITQTSLSYGSGNSINNGQSDYAYATLTQNGSGNTITASQAGGAFGAANTASVTQTSNSNSATYTQSGTGLSATITQH